MEALKPWIAPLGILAALLTAGLVVRAFISRRLRMLLKDKEGRSRLDDILLTAVERHVPLWFFLGGISAAAQASPLAALHQSLVHRLTVSCFFVSATFALSGFAAGAVDLYTVRFSASKATASLTESLAQGAVFLLGALLLLSNLGISVTPALTALGVGSLAVALALQDTLSNLFAGISIVSSRMVDVGEYVRLDSGFEGTVSDIGWRITRLKNPDGNDVALPNAKLSQSIIVNFGREGPAPDVAVSLAVPYGTDLAQARQAALETAAEVQGLPQALAAFKPTAYYVEGADSAVTLRVNLRAQSADDKAAVVSEFLQRVSARYARDGVAVAYPQRLIRLIPSVK